MLMQEVRAMARRFDLKTARASKADLIRSIQRVEGNFDCFGSAAKTGFCDQSACLWREDCFKPARKRKAG